MSNPSTATMTIAGRAIAGSALFEVFDPATGKTAAHAPDATDAELDAAVAAARNAFAGWAATSWAERQQALNRMAGLLIEHKDDLARSLVREQGKPLAQALREITIAAYWLGETAKMELHDEVLSDGAEGRAMLRRVPIGVVAALVPWNFPIVLAIWKIGPALLAGNTLVVKPSPFTPLTTLRIGELMREALPAGVLNVISGGDALGPKLTAHPGIDKISFTGSSATGQAVMRSASNGLKRLTLELGGNDAAIVLADANIDRVVPELFWGAFVNSGQICIAAKRIYIHESLYDAFAEAFAKMAKAVRVGPGLTEGTELGPVQNRRQYDRVCGLLRDCQAQGYEILAGGDVPDTEGWFIPPTVIGNPPDDSRIVREEPFGPIVPLLKFTTIDEVIARANASEYGLAGSVWTEDESAGEAVARRLATGTVWINAIQRASPFEPMGGHRLSGFGVENGTDGLREYTLPQTIALKRSR